MWKWLRSLDRKLNSWVTFTLDLVRFIKDITIEQYNLLSQKNVWLRKINTIMQSLLCDCLIVASEIWAYGFIFNKKEKILEKEEYKWFILEYKIAHKTTTRVLNWVDADIDINPWDYFVEMHLWDDFVGTDWSYAQKLRDLIHHIQKKNSQKYHGKICYIVWVSDLAPFLKRYWFDVATMTEYAQSETMLHNLKHGLIFKYTEVVGHKLDKFLWITHFQENPQSKFNSPNRNKRKIGLCYYKL